MGCGKRVNSPKRGWKRGGLCDTAGTMKDEVTEVISGVSSRALRARLGDKSPFNKMCENSASFNLASSSDNSAFSFVYEMSLSGLPTLTAVSTQTVSGSFLFQDV